MTGNEIRKSFVDFFKSKEHKHFESASLIPDDKTLAKELSDYTGMNLIDFYIVPHFGEEPFAESSEKIVELYKDKLDLKLINNKEVILIENDDFRIIKEKNKNR